MSSARLSRRLWCIAGSWAVILTMLVVARPVGAEPGSKPVGTLERFSQEARDVFPELLQGSPFESRMLNGTLVAVPQAGQLWQVYRSTALGQSGVLVRDDRTLEVVGSFRVPSLLRRATFSAGYGGEWLHALDGGRRVFLVDHRNQLLEVDTTTLTVRVAGSLSVSSLGQPGLDPLALGGLAYDRATGHLLVLYGGPPNTGVANRTTVLQRLDPATGTQLNRIVRSCTGPLPATDSTGDTLATRPLADADAIYVPCQRDSFAPGLGMFSSSIVVRIPRASLSDADGEEASVLVGGPMDTALLDPGAARITVLDWTGIMTVVDARTMTVVGSFPAAQPGGGSGRVGSGIDPDSGRVYFQSDLGLGSVDPRTTPLLPHVDPSAAAEAQEGVVVSGRHIYVLTGQSLQKAERFTIYKVRP